MNTRKGRLKFKNFRILLGSGCSYTIVIGRLVENNNLEKYAVMQRHKQAVNITTNLKVKGEITLPSISATNIVTWKCHLGDSAKGRYDMISGQYLLTELG